MSTKSVGGKNETFNLRVLQRVFQIRVSLFNKPIPSTRIKYTGKPKNLCIRYQVEVKQF